MNTKKQNTKRVTIPQDIRIDGAYPTLNLSNMPPDQWCAAVEDSAIRSEKWRSSADAMQHFAIRLLLAVEYVEWRRGGYCGDHRDHADAAREVKRLHRKLRKALGFASPDSGLLRL